MKNSTIKQHKQIGKELIPPFMQEPIGSVMHLCSWSKERLPEYVWIGLLRDSSITKTDFFNKFYYLKEYMLQTFREPCDKFSLILKLDSTKKEELYDKIKELFGNNVLDPIIVVSNFDKETRKSFIDNSKSNNQRIDKLVDIIEKMYDRHSDFAMDVRYSALILKINNSIFQNKI